MWTRLFVIDEKFMLYRFSSKCELETTWFQGDLEEIEQDVEEQIQIAIANGEFDNLEGQMARQNMLY